MKRLLVLTALVLTSTMLFAQAPEVSRDAQNGSKVLKGFISKKDLLSDTAFSWFQENQKGFTPDQNSIQQLKVNKDSINIIAFGGTWCGDTKHILPQFYALTDAAGFPENRITLLGVDRSKKTIQNLSEAFGITNVPTFIIMKNGKELGRIVEYGRIGMPDKEIGQILASAGK
jgi:thiol-disulfide isomerase/thioredoxin